MNQHRPPKSTRRDSLFRASAFAAISALAAASLHAQRREEAPPTAPSDNPGPARAEESATTRPATTQRGDVLELSPFTVDTTKDQGYYAENTLAGSRLNSNLADLAASITVVTKQQMEDTASVDINDVFRFEANTEGSSTYTPVVLDRGTAKDTLSGYSFGNDGSVQTNAMANRVRGMGAPDASMNYFPTNRRIPFDAYNTQSIEISRGPNSNIFGIGSPAGIVNQSLAQAALNRNTNSVQLRFDDRGSYRGSIAFNRSLIENQLALYVAFLRDNREFERKPSYDTTRRSFATLTFKPFPKTVIRMSAEGYRNDNRRPNFLTPRDYVTPWLQSGRPAYDPIARTITRLDTGQVYGPYTLSTLSPGHVTGIPTNDSALTSNTSPFYVEGITWFDYTRPLLRVDNGELVDWFQRQPVSVIPQFSNPAATALPTNATLNANPALWAIRERRWTSSAGLPTPANMSSYQQSGITSPAIYDWSSINTNQANFGSLRGSTYTAEIEQQLAPNLFFSAGWMRQDIDSVENYTISQTNGATVFVDTNLKLPNGEANPYFGLPYVEDFAPDTFENPEVNDNYRAALAYQLDLTTKDSWLRWLGRHSFMGMWSQQDAKRSTTRRRLEITSADADGALRYLPNPLFDGWNFTGGSLRRAYYLASPGDPQATITHSTGTWGNAGYGGPTSGAINVYNWSTGQFQDDQVGLETVFFHAGSGRSRRKIETQNLTMQNYLFDERIVTTFGWRHDDYRSRSTSTGQIFDSAGNVLAPALTTAQMYNDDGYANQELIMDRWNRWDELSGSTSTRGVVVRPFKGWNFIERPANNGSVLADFTRNLGFTYNESDNFNAPTSAQTDAFRTPLPKPRGEGKDWGVQFSLFNNKLVGRVNWFESTNENERTGAASTLISRLVGIDTTLFYGWASNVIRIQDGETPWDPAYPQNPPELTTAQQERAWALMGLPRDYYSGMSIGATQTNKAKGTEVQLTYNPVRNWTMKFTAGRQVTIFDDVAPEYDAWFAERMPVWLAATAPIEDYALRGDSTPISLANFWTSYGYNSNIRQSNTNGVVDVQSYFENIVDSQVALAKAQQGLVAPNQRKYRASFLTNYAFQTGMLKGFSVGGSQRWESKSAIGYLGREADPTRPGVMTASDPDKPVYDDGNYYTDLWIAYSRKILNNKYGMKIQLNVEDVFEDGGLQPIAVNWDGSPYAYRILDSRRFVLTTTFDF